MLIIKLAWRPWKLNPASQWLSVIALATLLFIFAQFSWFASAVSPIVQKLNSQKIITVYLDVQTSEGAVIDQIKTKASSSIRKMTYTDSQKFLQELETKSPELAREVMSLGDEISQVAPRFLTLEGNVTNAQIDSIKKINGVDSIENSQTRFQPLIDNLLAVQWFMRILLFALGLTAISALVLTARQNANIHQDAFALMKSLGGGYWKTRLPHLLSLTLTGFIAGLMASFAWVVTHESSVNKIKEFSPALEQIKSTQSSVFVLIIILGVFCGWCSAWLIPVPETKL